MLKRIEYQKFADLINNEMRWNENTWDWLLYKTSIFFLGLIANPLIAPFAVRLLVALPVDVAVIAICCS
jgi:hypothetical protein